MLVGFVLVAPLVVAFGFPVSFSVETLALLAVAGIGNVVGLGFVYAAVRAGKVGLVAAVASTEGAIAAAIALAAGESVSIAVVVVLVVIAAGVALSAIAPDEGIDAPGSSPRRAGLLAVGAALCFGVALYSTGRVGSELPLVWALLPPRIVGVAGVTLPLAATGRLRLTRSVAPFVVISGIAEVAGFAAFTFGAREAIAITAVLSSQFATTSAVLARVLFKERLSRLQIVGIAIVIAGVTALAVLRA